MKIKLWIFEIEISLLDGSCNGKVKYNREHTAKKAAQRMNCKPTTRRLLESYKCHICGCYHIGGRGEKW